MLVVTVFASRYHSWPKKTRNKFWCACLYEARRVRSGKFVWVHTGVRTLPLADRDLAIRDGITLANNHGAKFLAHRASLHYKVVSDAFNKEKQRAG